MSKVSNMLSMLQILKDGKIHKIQEIAEKLEVSERMVRQYKLELEMAGIYLKSYTGKIGGYQIDSKLDFFTIKNESKEELYLIMKKAIRDKNKAYIQYKSETKDTERIIHPAELFKYLEDWYIVGYCELRKEIRTFKLKNLLEYKILDEKYE